MNMNGIFPQGSPPSHLNPAALYANNNNQFDSTTFSPQNAAFPNHNQQQTFQPNSVVPAKRPHDNMSAGSPQISRSQTPSFFGNQQQQFPTPYAHLQQPGSNTASPSPTMSNQQFRPPGQQPRMQPTTSPSPFPAQSQQVGFGGQMSPATPQQTPQPTGPPQPGQMGNWNQNMNMPPAIQPQMNNGQVMAQAQRNYQAQLLQQQRQMQQSGMVGPRAQSSPMNNFAPQQQPAQMTNGQAGHPPAMNAQQQQQQQQHLMKRNGFLKQLMSFSQSQGRPFNPNPTIGGRVADLYLLWSFVTQLGGSSVVDKNQQWQGLAHKMNFLQAQYPGAAEELRQIFSQNLSGYERIWLSKRAQQKQQQARMNAHQMAGLGPAQPSPTRVMQPPNQQNQFQPGAAPTQATPVQANAQLAQHGMNTPQQMMHHRRSSSSIRKPDQMTPQPASQAPTGPSPHSTQKMQSPVAVKQPPVVAVKMKSEEVQSTNYVPHMRSIEMDGGYDMNVLYELGTTISKAMPNMPSVDEMGVIDTKAIMLSLASGLHAEVRYALDMLAIISNDTRIQFDLEKCEDLLDVIVDCAEEQTELLSDDAVEVSDALDLPSYEDMMRGSRAEVDGLQEVAAFGTTAYELDRAADKVIAITTVLRNFSFYEFNHKLLTSTPLIKWLCNTIRLLGTRNMLLRTHYNTQDFYKDMITFLSNVTQSLELPSRDDALHILHFLLAFAPQPAPSYAQNGDAIRFNSFVPTVHRYLPPAVDCLAKLLARQDPNRMFYKSIFTVSGATAASLEMPLDLLTRAFALSISILPDRSKGAVGNSHQLRVVEARKAYLSQGMLAADILTTLAPSNDAELARAWIKSEDGWAVGLLNLAALLSVDRSAAPGPKGPIGHDTETFKLISHRALAMLKRLAERAGKSGPAQHSTSNGAPNGIPSNTPNGDLKRRETQLPGWEGIPQSHTILGALMLQQSDCTSLGLLCNMYELVAQDGRCG